MVIFRSAAAASVLVPVLALTACASAGQPAAGPGATHSGRSARQLTIAQAREEFGAFLPRFMRLRRESSPGEARRLTVGAELQAQLFFKGQSGPAITQLTSEAFYVPRLAGYLRWILAAGRQGGGPAGRLFVMVNIPAAEPMSYRAIAVFQDADAAGVTTDARGSSSAALPSQPSGREAYCVPPAFVVPALGVTSVSAGMRLALTAADRVLAFAQPKGLGFIYPLINNGAATGVQESNAPG